MLNVYLKTAAYVGDLGRPGLRDVLHPPIDGGLWSGLSELAASPKRKVSPEVLARLLQLNGPINGITDYPAYLQIITACRNVALGEGCSLIELEQFWLGSATPPSEPGA
ncbi:hypothetical protein ETAA1_46590 [Urbifossiella limnaea]|uniref:Uncharacterized protein n=2 Tax=Urbifossiella limnaea TaxID=2528023 RepID=A0A517XYT8_9BACT|nr:hypothetical protein ETAA1_46590 [Urbifossiella limnaea]